MKQLVEKLRGRLRHGLLLQEILDLLAKAGLKIYPYLVFRENIGSAPIAPPAASLFEIRQLVAADSAKVAGIPERPQRESAIRARFDAGHLATGAFDGERLLAYSWCDLEHLCGIGRGAKLRPLRDHEAYLYDAYTVPAARGQGLVPLLRRQTYADLQQLGRDRVYSISLLFNQSARRFKAKLGAREAELRLSFGIGSRWHYDWRLKTLDGEGVVDQPLPAGAPARGGNGSRQ